MNLMEETINKELLRHAVSVKMFCPSCRTILDVQRAVMATRGAVSGVACVDCWTKHSTGRDLTGIEVLDGRELFPSRRKAAK